MNGDPFDRRSFDIQALPKTEGTRPFIRFTVHQIPEIASDGHKNPMANYWQFRVDFLMGGVQRNVDWYQLPQNTEPAPDAKFFFGAVDYLMLWAKNGERPGK
jgi:hypothetical protein